MPDLEIRALVSADPLGNPDDPLTDDVLDHDHYLAEGTDSQAAIAQIALLGTDRR